jgi:signal transduction histidine kinase
MGGDVLADVEALKAEVAAANAELEACSRAVSHDLRSPLATLSAAVELVLMDAGPSLSEESKHLLTRAQHAVERMTALLDAFAELGDAGRAPLRPEPIDLAAVARDILAGLAAARPGRRVEVAIAGPLAARADPKLVHVLLTEVLRSAWGAVQARVEVGAAGGAFYVRHDGSPSGPQPDAARLGLATASRIARRHGGRLWIDGPTVHFTLGDAAT